MLRLGSLAAVWAAPPAPPVHWHIKSAPAAVKPGATVSVLIAGEIDPGWHLYALDEPEGGPNATEISLTDGDAADLLNVEEAKPKTVVDPLFGMPVQFFAGSAIFTLHLKVNEATPAGAHTLHVLLRYQSCNDRVCLPPHTDTLEVPLGVKR